MSSSRGNTPIQSPPRGVSPGKPDDNDVDVDERAYLNADAHAHPDVVGGGDDRAKVVDQSSRSSLYLFILALSIGGLQIVWSVELSYGSPYLLSLGMSKALLALVWIAGPLTGTLVQPYVGIRSDNCRITWGKRKPFMAVGGAATVFCLLALAWIREIVGGFLGVFGVESRSEGVKVTTIVLATILMYGLDFAINTVQAACRAFIVDNAPAHQQEAANAWASRLVGAGNIVGYILGYLDLPKLFPFFGNTQFKVLCVIASLSLAFTLIVSMAYIQERDPRLEGPPASDGAGLIAFFKQVFRSVRRMPAQIRKVCEVQVAAWVGWFPFLFYSTTYIGQLYVNPIFDRNRNLSDDEIDRAWEEATRVGTFALLVDAVVCFIANIVLPLLVVPSYKQIHVPAADRDHQHDRHDEVEAGAASSEPLLGNRQMTGLTTTKEAPVQGKWAILQIPGLTLRRTWLLSHVLFTLCMFTTFFITTPAAGTAMIGIVGISWAVTLWAPFALISAEVAQLDADRRLKRQHQPPRSDLERATTHDDDDDEEDDGATQAGIVLGLHNVAVSFPQFLSTLISSVIFRIFQKPRGEPYDDSVGWVMRFGGCAALVAAVLTARLEEKGRR